MKLNTLCVFDLETSSLDTATTQILEIACLMVDPVSLEIIPNSTFSTLVRPEDEEAIDPGALAKNQLKMEDLRQAPQIKIVWSRFTDHVKRFATKRGAYSAPFPCGKNVRGFDLPIIERYCQRFGPKDSAGGTVFNRQWVYDIEEDLLRWLGFPGLVDSLSMDVVRDYMGIPKVGAHRALKDVEDTAAIACRFLKFYQRNAGRSAFKGCFSDGDRCDSKGRKTK